MQEGGATEGERREMRGEERREGRIKGEERKRRDFAYCSSAFQVTCPAADQPAGSDLLQMCHLKSGKNTSAALLSAALGKVDFRGVRMLPSSHPPPPHPPEPWAGGCVSMRMF